MDTQSRENSIHVNLPDTDLGEEQHESYFQLVWQRFRKSRPAIAGGLMVLSLIILAIFAEFFAPVDPTDAILQDSFIPPTRIRMIDDKKAIFTSPVCLQFGRDNRPQDIRAFVGRGPCPSNMRSSFLSGAGNGKSWG